MNTDVDNSSQAQIFHLSRRPSAFSNTQVVLPTLKPVAECGLTKLFNAMGAEFKTYSNHEEQDSGLVPVFGEQWLEMPFICSHCQVSMPEIRGTRLSANEERRVFHASQRS